MHFFSLKGFKRTWRIEFEKFWQQRSKRERVWLIMGGLFSLLTIYWQGLYLPLQQHVENKRKQLQEKQQLVVWLEQQVHHKTSMPNRKPLRMNQLLDLISKDMHQQQFQGFPYQLEQMRNNQQAVQLHFEQVPYNLILSWLWHTESTYQMTIKQLSIDKTNIVGLVKVTVEMDL